jgi:hypothetical protein
LTTTYKCRNCDAQIKFDSSQVSASGKVIPLNAIDGNPHDCPNRPRLPQRYKPSGPTVKLGAPPAYDRGFQAETITKINHIYERLKFQQAEIVALQHEVQQLLREKVASSSGSGNAGDVVGSEST